jgi:glycerol uptake facilitator protein
MGTRRELGGVCVAEGIGTFLLVFFGTGSVFVAVLTGALQGLLQVAIVWGIAVTLSIYATGAISGSHLNPAVTLACSIWRDFPRSRILPYILAQTAGAFAASCVLYVLFQGILGEYELTRGIVRGASGSQETAMLFGEYFPHPLQVGMDAGAVARVSLFTAMLAEGGGTAFQS